MKDFSWLHFSDLHFNPGIPGFDAARAKEALIERIRNDKFPPYDYIFITGDVADRGIYDEKQFSWIQDTLIPIPAIQQKKVFWAVGNHDMRRKKNRTESIRSIRNAGRLDGDPDELAEGIYLASSSADYSAKLKDFCNHTFDPRKPHQLIPLPEFNLIILNTCLTSCDDDKEGLLIAEQSFMNAFNEIKEKEKPLFVIGHHGIFGSKFLMPNEEKRICLEFDDKGVDVYLCGHSHDIGCHSIRISDREIHQFTSGTVGIQSGNPAEKIAFLHGSFNAESRRVHITPYLYSLNGTNWWAVDYNQTRRLKENNSFLLERLSPKAAGRNSAGTRTDGQAAPDLSVSDIARGIGSLPESSEAYWPIQAALIEKNLKFKMDDYEENVWRTWMRDYILNEANLRRVYIDEYERDVVIDINEESGVIEKETEIRQVFLNKSGRPFEYSIVGKHTYKGDVTDLNGINEPRRVDDRRRIYDVSNIGRFVQIDERRFDSDECFKYFSVTTDPFKFKPNKSNNMSTSINFNKFLKRCGERIEIKTFGKSQRPLTDAAKSVNVRFPYPRVVSYI